MKLTNIPVLTISLVLWTSSVKSQRLHLNQSCEQRNERSSYDGITLRGCSLCHKEPVELGSNVTLSCELYNYCSITWYHRGIELHPGNRLRIENDDQYLLITNVTERDIGEYWCVAFNGNETLKYKGFLSIQETVITELAIIDYNLQHRPIVEENVVLSCDAVNEDKMTWYHNGELVVTEKGRYGLQDSGRRLFIQSLRVDDSGNYTCVASNATHNVSREGFMSVHCRSGDVILQDCTPGFNITAPLGSNLYVECTFDTGDSDLHFLAAWYKVVGTTNYTDSTHWVSPDLIDLNGATVNLPRERMEFKNDENCKRSKLFYTLGMNVSNITEDVYGYYVIIGYKFFNWHPSFVFIGRESQDIPTVVKVAAVTSPTPIFLLCFALSWVVWKKFHLDIKLFLKDFKNNNLIDGNNENDGKLYDVYIACSDEDISFVVTAVVPVLNEKGYTTCCRFDFLPGGGNSDAISECMKASRCCLLIVSQGIFSQRDLVLFELRAATETFSDRRDGVIPVTIDGVSETDIAQSPVLKQYLVRNPRLNLRGENMTLNAFRKSDVLKGMRLAFPLPSERNPTRWRHRRQQRSGLVDQEIQPARVAPVSVSMTQIEENNFDPKQLTNVVENNNRIPTYA